MPTKSVAVGAIVATITFPAVVIALNIIQAGHHDPLRQPASQLALGPDGWIMNVAFCALAVGTLLVAYLLRQTLGSYRPLPVIFLIVAGVLGFVPAIFSTDPSGVHPTTHGIIHNLNGLVTFILYVAAIIASAFAFRTNPYWRDFQRTTAVWAVGAVLSFVLLLVLGGVGFFGLGERIAIAVWVAWLVAIAGRILLRNPSPTTGA